MNELERTWRRVGTVLSRLVQLMDVLIVGGGGLVAGLVAWQLTGAGDLALGLRLAWFVGAFFAGACVTWIGWTIVKALN